MSCLWRLKRFHKLPVEDQAISRFSPMARKQHACFSWSATVTLGIRISDGWEEQNGVVSIPTRSLTGLHIDDQTFINYFPICMFVPSVRRYPFFKQHRIERFDWARLQVVIHLARGIDLCWVPRFCLFCWLARAYLIITYQLEKEIWKTVNWNLDRSLSHHHRMANL